MTKQDDELNQQPEYLAAHIALYGHEDDDDVGCPYCDDGWVLVGADVDCEDGVNGPFDGDVIPCPCCGGSGDGE